ncbi:hypothetical protein OG453_23615 [Streptomyces sp. NBC_01381]|uniref:hypothetical protein n=1 Tax=Streptomyces sp. NBC_01381 TaxID=2903845 RepID=UPI0022584820|nr:hypothetical protein [Streptomyces sp. NBC_01381]MCX4669635.1 hypothetical protein [Streptomyces sp. NBC_01381]
MSEASPAAVQALRDAMTRLMEGRPKATDGKMTKENLYREAGVSRATMNRATVVMAEWDAYLDQHGRRTVGESRRDAEITELQRKLKAKTQECTQLQQKLEAAATVIGALHHDNEAMREHIASRGGTVVSLDSRRGATD